MKIKGIIICFIICIAVFTCTVCVVELSEKADGVPASVSSIPKNTFSPLLCEPDVAVFGECPNVYAQSAALIDAKSGGVIFEKDSDVHLPMASTTKIMTAYVVLNNLPIDKVVTVPEAATLIEGSSLYLKKNEKISVETLLYGLMLESGNDAAYSLAVACSGSPDKFACLMNNTAKEIGLTDTSFANPHGLSAENHYTTAYELAYLTSVAMKNKKFDEIVSTKKYLAPSLDGDVTRYFSNHNKLLRYYDGAIGVKTGYTKAAGRCLVSAAERDGDRYIAVTLNDGNDWSDHKNMLDYAFENFQSVEIAAERAFGIYINGKRYSNPEGIYLTVSRGYMPELSYSVALENEAITVKYYANGKELGKFHLTAETPAMQRIFP